MSADGQGDLDILIIEDNEALARSLRDFLTGQGLLCDITASPAAAIQRVDQDRVSLLVASMGLRNDGGMTLAAQIKRRPGAWPKVLLLATARTSGRVLKAAKAAGVEGVVQKSGGPRAILDRINRILPTARRLGGAGGASAPEPRPAAARQVRTDRRGRPLPPGIQVRGRMKPQVERALSGLRRRTNEPDEPWAAPSDALGEDPLFTGMPEESRAALSRAEEEHRQGLAEFEAGNHGEALQHFTNAWSLEPSTAVYLAYKIRCQAILSPKPLDPDGDAGDDLRMAAMLDPSLPEPHLFLGYLYLDAKRPADARKYLKQALDLDPTNSAARAALSKVVNAT